MIIRALTFFPLYMLSYIFFTLGIKHILKSFGFLLIIKVEKIKKGLI